MRWSRASWEYRCARCGGWRPNSWPNSGRGVGSRRGCARLSAAGSTPALTCRAAARPRQRTKPNIHDFLTTNSVRRGIRLWCRDLSGSRTAGTILLTSRLVEVAQSTTSDIRGFRPGVTRFVSSGTNHARKEPGRSRDSSVTLLHCSIRTRRIRTALATRRAQRGSPAQGWRVRTAAGGQCWDNALGVAQQPPVGRGVAFLRVPCQRGHECRGHWLPADRLALFPEQDQALLAVEVGRAQGERAAAAAGSLSPRHRKWSREAANDHATD